MAYVLIIVAILLERVSIKNYGAKAIVMIVFTSLAIFLSLSSI